MAAYAVVWLDWVTDCLGRKRKLPRKKQKQRQKREPKKKSAKGFFDFYLLFAVLFIAGFGMIMMYSASSYSQVMKGNDAAYLLRRQAEFALSGVLIMLGVSRIDYHWLRTLMLPIYIIAMLAVAATFVIGLSSHGSARWLGVGGARFQPSEVMKAAIIIVMASNIKRYGPRINEWKIALICMVWVIVPVVAIATSNLSTAIIILGISIVMLFVACERYLPFVAMGGAGLFCYIFAYPLAKLCEHVGILHDYQLKRIFMWKDPASYADDTFQTLQGLYAIGSGGLFGKGLGQSIQKFLMPEAQNDMIFTIICEELGLFGAVSVLLIFAFIIYRLLVIANNAPDEFGALLVTGVMAHIALQVILNLAVVTNSMPNTGITLPFISYGGTSLWILMGEIGMVLAVSRKIRVG